MSFWIEEYRDESQENSKEVNRNACADGQSTIHESRKGGDSRPGSSTFFYCGPHMPEAEAGLESDLSGYAPCISATSHRQSNKLTR